MAKKPSITIRDQNVIVLRPDDSMTSADMVKAKRVLHLLPAGWFKLVFQRVIDFDTPLHHLVLERVGGAPVGSFTIAREGRTVVVEAIGEAGSYAGTGPCYEAGTIEDAIKAVRAHIDAVLTGWSVQLAA